MGRKFLVAIATLLIATLTPCLAFAKPSGPPPRHHMHSMHAQVRRPMHRPAPPRHYYHAPRYRYNYGYYGGYYGFRNWHGRDYGYWILDAALNAVATAYIVNQYGQPVVMYVPVRHPVYGTSYVIVRR